MDRSDWIEHRRGDRERVGWMRPEGDGFVAIDLLGREVSPAIDWLDAEELLETLGIGYLADAYLMAQDGGHLRVRITEVSTERIRVKKDDFGAIDVPLLEYVLPWPMPPELRPRHAKSACRGPVRGENEFPHLARSTRDQSVLTRCALCGALWSTRERETRQLTGDEALVAFPEAVLP